VKELRRVRGTYKNGAYYKLLVQSKKKKHVMVYDMFLLEEIDSEISIY
jgi:hypothetical protein